MTVTRSNNNKLRSKANLSRLRGFAVNKIIFLVKPIGTISKSTFFTQYILPDVRPLKAYFRSCDVTKLLTSKNQLTQFTYEFLCGIACEEGFTFGEIRSFFYITYKSKTSKRLRSSPDPKIQNKTPLKRVAFSQGSEEQIDSAVSSVPVSTPEEISSAKNMVDKRPRPADSDDEESVPLIKRFASSCGKSNVVKDKLSSPCLEAQVDGVHQNPLSSGANTEHTSGAERIESGHSDLEASEMEKALIRGLFKNRATFTNALRLVCLNINPQLRFNLSRYEMYYDLSRQFSDKKIMSKFKQYLELEIPSLLTPKAMTSVMNDYISFGGIASGVRTVYFKTDIETVSSTQARWFNELEI